MSEQIIKAKDLTIGTAVKFYDGHMHRVARITKFKRADAKDGWDGKKMTKLTLYVQDSRGWGNYLAPTSDVTIDLSL